MALPSNVCDRCGYAHGIKRVMLMVEGRAANDLKLCGYCLTTVLDIVRSQATA